MASLGVDLDQFAKKIQTQDIRAHNCLFQQPSAGPLSIMGRQNQPLIGRADRK